MLINCLYLLSVRYRGREIDDVADARLPAELDRVYKLKVEDRGRGLSAVERVGFRQELPDQNEAQAARAAFLSEESNSEQFFAGRIFSLISVLHI